MIYELINSLYNGIAKITQTNLMKQLNCGSRKWK